MVQNPGSGGKPAVPAARRGRKKRAAESSDSGKSAGASAAAPPAPPEPAVPTPPPEAKRAAAGVDLTKPPPRQRPFERLRPLLNRLSALIAKFDLSNRLKLAEVTIAVLFLLVSLWVGVTAQKILEKQNHVLEEQTRSTIAMGDRQTQAMLLQAYIAANDGAGFATAEERRKLHLAMDLYLMLLEHDGEFEMLHTSMPELTSDELDQLSMSRPQDRLEIQQIWNRRGDIARGLDDTGRYNLVLGTFRVVENAGRRQAKAVEFFRTTNLAPDINIFHSDNDFYLVTISPFATKEKADKAIREHRLSAQFPGVYVSRKHGGWEIVCTARLAICTPSGRWARSSSRP